MVEITNDSYERFDRRFPATMMVKDIAAELSRMSPQEAEEYDTILCSELFNAWCTDYILFTRKRIKSITGSEEYNAFKSRLSNLSNNSYLNAWAAFLDERKKDVKTQIHQYFQSLHNDNIHCIEYVITLLLYAFKNAYKGFWELVKQEVSAVPHDEITAELCDIIDAFYGAETDGDALEVLAAAYQKYPDSPTINEMMGIVYFDGKQYGNSIAAIERLYDEETDSYNAVLNRQDTIFYRLAFASERLNDRKAAIDYYEKALAIDPFSPFVASNLGYVYYRDRQYEKAYAILKRCIDEKLESNIVFPINHLARLLYAMGRYHEAKEFIKTAPAKVSKSIREKIEKAPDTDNASIILPPPINADDEEDHPEPENKPIIERKGSQFQSEKLLEDELTMRMDAGMNVFGLPLKIYRRRGEYGRQYIFPEGRLDILAEDKDSNLYIIELKKDSGYDDAYKQTVHYIEWFQKHKAKEKKVYGIICLNSPGKALIEAVRKDERIKLYEYQISYNEIK